MTAISAPDAAIYRTHPHTLRRHLSTIPRDAVFTCQLAEDPNPDDFFNSYSQVLVDNITGSVSDVRNGMTIDVGTAPGLADIGKLRVRDVQFLSADLMVFNEVSPAEMPLVNNLWMTVRDEFLVWPKMPRLLSPSMVSEDYPTFFVELHDFDKIMIDQNIHIEPVANVTRTQNTQIPVKFAGWLDAGQTYRTVTLSAFQSFPVATGATISSYLWDVKDGTITVGSDSNHTITVRFPEGFRHVQLTVTDSNGKTAVRYVPIWSHDRTTSPPFSSFRVVKDDREDDRQMAFEIFGPTGIATTSILPENTTYCYWEEAFFGSTPAPESYIGQFLGWSTEEDRTLQYLKGLRTINVLGPAGWLSLFDGFAQTVSDQLRTPETWYEMEDITIDRIIHYILREYTTALPLINLYFSDYAVTGPGEDIGKAPIWTQIKEIARAGLYETAGFDSGCGLWLRREYSYLDSADRLLRDKIFGVEPTDLLDGSPVALKRGVLKRVGGVDGGGASWDGVEPVVFASLAPGLAMSYAPGKESAPFQRLPIVNSQIVLNRVTGDHFARLNSRQPDMSFPLIGNYDFFEPAWREPLTFTWGLDTVHNTYVSVAQYNVKSVSVSHSNEVGQPPKRVSLTCEEVTQGLPGETRPVPVVIQPPDYQIPEVPGYAPEEEFTDYANPPAGYPHIGVLFGGGISQTEDFNDASPTWVFKTLPLDPATVLHDGVQKPGAPHTLIGISNNGKLRTYVDITGTPATQFVNTLAHPGRACVQIERNEPSLVYCLSYDSGGLWSQGSHDGGSSLITANRIGAALDMSGIEATPAIYVDIDNPSVAYTVSYDGTSWRLYKTSNGGGSWALTSDYIYNNAVVTDWETPFQAVGSPWFGPATAIERSRLDPSALYIATYSTPNGDLPMQRLEAASGTIISPRYNPPAFTRWMGTRSRRGLRTLDNIANRVLFVAYRPTGFGNYSFGVYKAMDTQTAPMTVVIPEAAPHNAPSGGVVGSDGIACYIWKYEDILYGNFETMDDPTDLVSKAGTGYPTGGTGITLFGL